VLTKHSVTELPGKREDVAHLNTGHGPQPGCRERVVVLRVWGTTWHPQVLVQLF